MSPQSNIPQGPPSLHFLLDTIILEVNSAKRTHAFLCDVFGKADELVPWPDTAVPPPQGSSLSPDGMHGVFSTGNTRIQFSTATPPSSARERSVRIAVLIRDIRRARRALDQNGVT